MPTSPWTRGSWVRFNMDVWPCRRWVFNMHRYGNFLRWWNKNWTWMSLFIGLEDFSRSSCGAHTRLLLQNDHESRHTFTDFPLLWTCFVLGHMYVESWTHVSQGPHHLNNQPSWLQDKWSPNSALKKKFPQTKTRVCISHQFHQQFHLRKERDIRKRTSDTELLHKSLKVIHKQANLIRNQWNPAPTLALIWSPVPTGGLPQPITTAIPWVQTDGTAVAGLPPPKHIGVHKLPPGYGTARIVAKPINRDVFSSSSSSNGGLSFSSSSSSNSGGVCSSGCVSTHFYQMLSGFDCWRCSWFKAYEACFSLQLYTAWSRSASFATEDVWQRPMQLLRISSRLYTNGSQITWSDPHLLIM